MSSEEKDEMEVLLVSIENNADRLDYMLEKEIAESDNSYKQLIEAKNYTSKILQYMNDIKVWLCGTPVK